MCITLSTVVVFQGRVLLGGNVGDFPCHANFDPQTIPLIAILT